MLTIIMENNNYCKEFLLTLRLNELMFCIIIYSVSIVCSASPPNSYASPMSMVWTNVLGGMQGKDVFTFIPTTFLWAGLINNP